MTGLPERLAVIALVAEAVGAGARQDKACAVISLSERTLQRWQRDASCGDRRPARVHTPNNRLSAQCAGTRSTGRCRQLRRVRKCAAQPDRAAPGRSGGYLASESTFYRVLKARNQLGHRGAERPAQARYKPRALTASAPGQLYSWDITYLPTPVKGIYFYLYMFMDIFSRKIVGWQVYDVESSERAGEVVRDICQRENIAPEQVVLHSDNGSPMKGRPC